MDSQKSDSTRMPEQSRSGTATKPLFDWSSWRTKLPPLEKHSQANLDVLRTYIEYYIQIICTNTYGKESFPNISRWLRGGGKYEGDKFGFPFVLLQAVQVAEARLNQARTKGIIIDGHFYFVESDDSAADCLEHELRQHGYGPRLGQSTFLVREKFATAQLQIVSESRTRFSRGGARLIFFLDQCGYTDAPLAIASLYFETINVEGRVYCEHSH